jgi:hypothetical protein
MFGMIRSELALAVKANNRIWLLLGSVLIVAACVVPFDIARQYVVPAAMIVPLVSWSSIGTRELQYNTWPLLFSSPGAHTRQYAAMLATGVILGLIMIVPMVVRGVILGEYIYSLTLLSASLVIPSTAFALGVISGTRKLFEAVFPLVWYGGSIDRIKAIDLLGTAAESTDISRVVVLFILSLLGIALSYTARRRRVSQR